MTATFVFQTAFGSMEKAELENNEYRDTGHLRLVLEVLASMCDGQNELSQNYLRDQWDNLKTIDLVGETCNFLPLLINNQVNRKSIHLITQLIDTLIEMVLGNEPNQEVTCDHKVCLFSSYMKNQNMMLLLTQFTYILKELMLLDSCQCQSCTANA